MPRVTVPGGINAIKTLMGWNQTIRFYEPMNDNIIPSIFGNADGASETFPFLLRVNSFNIGSKQTGEAPDYVTGATDRTAYSKGPVEIGGSLAYPLTIEDSDSKAVSGFALFRAGAELVRTPALSFTLRGAYGEVIQGCKVATTQISCEAKGHVECTSDVWGISNDVNNYSDPDHPKAEPSPQNYGIVDGDTYVNGKLKLVQIPMWDACLVSGAPEGMLVTGFSINIDNKLQRNYTLGNGTGYSPFGLNATSISAGQRMITGTIKWQSKTDGSFSSIMGTGIKTLTISIYKIGTITLQNCLWNANPPTINTGDRMVCESAFTALGDQGTFDALTITTGDGSYPSY